MTEPVCPSGWDCEFTRTYAPQAFDGPWWEGPWGIVVGILAVIALTIVLVTLAYYWHQLRESQRQYNSVREERAHKLAIEEQRTMQVDSAKGNAEVLTLVKEMQRNNR